MREIRFRGKAFVDNIECENEGCKKWVFGSYCVGPGPTHFIQEYEDIVTYKVIPETIGQYTGLKDRNGVRIFEGDILRDPQGNKGKVFWHTANALFAVNWKRLDGNYETDNCIGYGEVIGNIHDNPELLEASND